MTAPLLSVCLITYNHVNYIREAIDSILMQKVNFPWELIIADDRSIDGTREILLEYKKKYPDFIKLILQEKNVGAAKNWLDLMSSPKAKYIAYLEGDDYWIDPCKLQKQVCFLESNPKYSLCFHNAFVKNRYKKTQYMFNKKMHKRTYNTKDIILKSWFTPSASLVYRNKIKIPLLEDVSGDMVMIFLNSLIGDIYYFPEVMSVYNYGGTGSASQRNTRKNLYHKKYKLLNYYDKCTNYKFIFYTSLRRVRTTIGMFFSYFRR